MNPQPATLGYSSKTSQSAYYPGSANLSAEEIEAVTRLMDAKKIAPENTRLERSQTAGVFEVLQASAEQDIEAVQLGQVSLAGQERPIDVVIRRGDHHNEMNKICAELTAARKLATTEEQKLALSQLIRQFSDWRLRVLSSRASDVGDGQGATSRALHGLPLWLS